jgi:hypothetical protein
MDLVEPTAHASIVRAVLEEYAAFAPSQGEVEVELVADEAHGHFELLYVGWEGWRRIHGVVVHVDLRGDEVWVQHDGTEGGIADAIIARGVDPRRVVLAFQHPYMGSLPAAG